MAVASKRILRVRGLETVETLKKVAVQVLHVARRQVIFKTHILNIIRQDVIHVSNWHCRSFITHLHKATPEASKKPSLESQPRTCGPPARPGLPLLGFFIRGFIWDIPILFFSYVLFWDPTKEPLQRTRQMPSWKTPQLQREVGLERYWFSSCSLRRRSYVGF